MKAKPRGMRPGRRSWKEKLRPDQQPKICEDPRGRGRMLVPTPMLVAAEVSRVRRGRVITMSQLRDRLATRSGADLTCPLCTGIFINIVAGAAEDDLAAGRKPVAPYWRVVRDDGSLSEKLPPGPARQAHWLREEGQPVRRAGANWQLDGIGLAPGQRTALLSHFPCKAGPVLLLSGSLPLFMR